ncbi:class I adenylate-forming enzyme family protein [Streptacidiphilus sp. PAMC 29251]
MNDDGWWGEGLLAAGAPEAAWAHCTDTMDFGALREQTARLARILTSYGIRPGSTVALHGSPSFTHLWSVFALWSLGAQVILLEPSLSLAEREALLRLSSPQFVLTLGQLRRDEELFVSECEVLVRRRPDGRSARTDHCLVQFSSGTTGRPKAVGRTPGSLMTEVARLGTLALMPRAGERVAVLEPVAHSFALIGGVLHALAVGATLVFPACGERDAVVEAVTGAQVVLGRPRHFGMLVQAPAGLRLPSLRLAVSGGDVLAGETSGAFARRYGVLVGQAYGTTETGLVAADLAGGRGPHTLGVPMPGVRTRTVGGALQVLMPSWPYPYETAPSRTTADGFWLETHDLVTRDPATGVLSLRGRAGRTRAGADLLDIEAVLRAHRHVTDAVVLGPDPVEAHVSGTEELRSADLSAWCERFLDTTSAPRRFHVVPELARSASGKLLRDRARLAERGWAPPPVAVGNRPKARGR